MREEDDSKEREKDEHVYEKNEFGESRRLQFVVTRTCICDLARLWGSKTNLTISSPIVGMMLMLLLLVLRLPDIDAPSDLQLTGKKFDHLLANYCKIIIINNSKNMECAWFNKMYGRYTSAIQAVAYKIIRW